MDWGPCYLIYINELMRALEQSYSTRHWSQFFWLFADDLVPLSTKTKGLQQHLPAHSVRKIMILWKRHSSIQFKIICIALFTKQSLQSRKLSFYNRFIYRRNLIYLTFGKKKLFCIFSDGLASSLLSCLVISDHLRVGSRHPVAETEKQIET